MIILINYYIFFVSTFTMPISIYHVSTQIITVIKMFVSSKDAKDATYIKQAPLFEYKVENCIRNVASF